MSDDTEMTTYPTGGLRFNAGKMARHDLISPEFLHALAVHLGHGAVKYTDRNWEKGLSCEDCYASLQHHAVAWHGGQDIDSADPRIPDYRAHHMVAVAWNAMVLFTFAMRGTGIDDRVKSAKESIK